MAKYNLNLNGNFTSTSISGIGKSLHWSELESIMDYDTTSSGVSIVYWETLNLETDLSDRIIVDGIRLYMSSSTASGTIMATHLDFYYKNEEEDDYTLANKYSNGTYYYATIPQPSAPRYILCTISGIDANIHEYQILNDDYIVSFGEDGTLTEKRLDRTTIGQSGDATAIPIFNNDALGTEGVNAYVCVDVDGLGDDISSAEYLEISNSENGTYYVLNDGTLMDSNDTVNNYYWDMGTFDNTEVNSYVNEEWVELSANSAMNSLITLPMTDSSENWKVFTRPCCYNAVRSKMYFLGADTGTRLRLYEYNYIDNTFAFVSDIKYGAVTESQYKYHASIACVKDNYIYVNYAREGDGFGRYNLNGLVNNWEQLADIPVPPGYNSGTYDDLDEVCIFSDDEEYIYAITRDHDYDTPGNYFGRYSTISGAVAGWENLATNYVSAYSRSYVNYGWKCLIGCTYDKDRNCIYMTVRRLHTYFPSAKYIQRYDVATDNWDSTWFYLEPLIDVSSRMGADIAYHGDYIYIGSGSVNSFFKLYIPTLTLETVATNFHLYAPAAGVSQCPNIFIKESHLGATALSDIILYFNDVNGARNKLYSYGGAFNEGTYTTPIIELADQYNASYFVVKATTSDSTNCSTDKTVRNGAIEVKSSNEKPVNADKIYWPNRTGDNTRISEYSAYSGQLNLSWNTGGAGNYWLEVGMAARPKTGHVIVSRRYIYGSTTYNSHVNLMNPDGSSAYVATRSGDHGFWFSKMVFEVNGGVWGMCLQSPMYRLVHFNEQLDEISTVHASDLTRGDYTMGAMGDPFVTDICEVTGGDGVWMCYYYDNQVKRLNHSGEEDFSIYDSSVMSDPTRLAPRSDGGCWILHEDGSKLSVINGDSSGTLPIFGLELTLPYVAEELCSDYDDGVWYTSGQFVYRINNSGVQTHEFLIGRPAKVYGGHGKCFVWSDYYDRVYYIDIEGVAEIKAIYDLTVGWSIDLDTPPAIFSLDYSSYIIDSENTVSFPQPDDPVWGSGGLDWNTVAKNGYFLPKVKYQQARITLSSLVSDDTPTLDKVIMAPAVKLQEVQPQSSKDMYIKTSIPDTVSVQDYEVKLRTWWRLID